jgi:hypothetical protein
MKFIFSLPKKLSYALLALLISLLGFLLSLIPSTQKANADLSNNDYCGIAGAGYMSAYCTGLGFDITGACGSTGSGPCCNGVGGS